MEKEHLLYRSCCCQGSDSCEAIPSAVHIHHSIAEVSENNIVYLVKRKVSRARCMKGKTDLELVDVHSHARQSIPDGTKNVIPGMIHVRESLYIGKSYRVYSRFLL